MDGQYAERFNNGNASLDCAVPSDSVIWVNIFDPINGPSFKPSPLKPIPLFMQRPRIPIIEPQRQASAVDAYLQSPLPLASLRNSVSAPSTLCPTRATTPIVSISTPTRAHSRVPSQDMIGDSGPLDVRRQQAPAFVREEALKRPSSRLAARHRRSQSRSSLYQTPPEYMDATHQPPSLDESRIPPLQHYSVLSFPTHSSEYLERYQPLSTPATRRLEMLMEQSRRAAPKVGRGRDEEDDVRTELRKFFSGR